MATVQTFLNACEKGDTQTFKQVMSKVNINEKNENGYSGLALAVRNGHTEISYSLIRADADINSINEAGQSVLFLACWHNREELVKALIQSGALINIADNRGWTPLIISVYHNYIPLVLFLLEHGADPSHKDCFGKKAIERAKTDEMAEVLMKYDSTEKRTTPNALGKLISSSMSSIQSDQKPPIRSSTEFKRVNKLQEDLECHVKYQTKKIEKELSVEWSEILEQCLNEELFQAEQILLEEIENFVMKNLQENYLKIRQQVLSSIDENYRNKGYKIPSSHIPFNFTPQVAMEKPGRVQKTLEKVKLESDDLFFNSSSADPNEIRVEVVRFIENSIENLAGKFERISSDVISAEIPMRIHKMKNLIAAEIKEIIDSNILAVKKNIDMISEERIREITNGNREKNDKGYKESHSASFVQPERSKNKFEENYEFIENVANNYSGFNKSSHLSNSLSGSFVGERKKNNGKNTPKAVPRSEASALLQQFLKK